MGYFDAVHASPDESWVTVGESPSRRLARGGDVLLARTHWSRTNRLA